MTGKKTDIIEGFRKRLLTMEAEIHALLSRTAQDSKPVDLNLPIGRLSRADAIQMQNMAALNKRQLEIKFVSIPAVHRAIDWIRKRRGHPPLQLPDGIGKEKTDHGDRD